MTVTDPKPLAIASVVVDGVGHLHLSGEFDAAGAGSLEQRLESMGPPAHLRVHLAGVTFLDSTALSCLMRARERALAAGGSVVLDQASPCVVRLLELTGLDEVFEQSNGRN